MNFYESRVDATGLRVAVIVGRFNQLINAKLLDGCLEELLRRGARPEDVDVPGCPAPSRSRWRRSAWRAAAATTPW